MKDLTWTPMDRARAMVKQERDAGRTVSLDFAAQIAAAIHSEVDQRTKGLEEENRKIKSDAQALLMSAQSVIHKAEQTEAKLTRFMELDNQRKETLRKIQAIVSSEDSDGVARILIKALLNQCIEDLHRGTECGCGHLDGHCCSHHCCCFYRCNTCQHNEGYHQSGACNFGDGCSCQKYVGESRG